MAATVSLLSTARAQDSTKAANLVYNPSFEEYLECPQRIDALGTLTTVEAWYQPTSGSADYYNICGRRECGVPDNKLGSQLPRTGDAYCGIYCSQEGYREYLQTELKEPLRRGATYEVTFHVSLAELSPEAVGTIGALFTRERIADTTHDILMHRETRKIGPAKQAIATFYTPQICGSAERPLSDTEAWQRVSGRFVAEGGERFMTIGNFLPTSRSGVLWLGSETAILRGSYYYIDDVSVVCVDCATVAAQSETVADNRTPVAEAKPELRSGSVFVLEDIHFEFDRSTLLQQSYHELLRLRALLDSHPRMKIEISGHTDGQGSEKYNQRLSENRARAVYDYLVGHGIDARRLRYRGYGKSKPRASNATDEGRALNRRVEIKILSMD